MKPQEWKLKEKKTKAKEAGGKEPGPLEGAEAMAKEGEKKQRPQ